MPQRSLAPAALRRLMGYRWPGNVRELRNAIERAVVLAEGKELAAKDLADELADHTSKDEHGATSDAGSDEQLMVPFTADFREDRKEFERRYIVRCLEHTGGNVTQAAVTLGMHRQSLQHKLRELGLARRYVSAAQEKSDT
ncbi:MAG: helix-turn-helix domain-containing protein [Pyrinomonadaceae bacterium]